MWQWEEVDALLTVDEMLRDGACAHWEKCRAYVHALVQRWKMARDDREDVIQNVMLAIIHGLPNFRHQSCLSTWIFTITAHELRSYMVKHERAPLCVMPEAEITDERLRATAPASALLSRSTEAVCQMQERLAEVLAALVQFCRQRRKPERDIHMLVMAFYEDCRVEDIAQYLEISTKTVRRTLCAARNHLRKVLPYLNQAVPLAS